MGKQEEQKWWTALSGWMEQQGGAELLFVYDKTQKRLERCFGRNTELKSVDAETVGALYQAAAEGRLGLLRPDGLKPQLLTTDPAEMFASGKEAAVEESPLETMLRLDEQKWEQEREEEEKRIAAQDLFIWAAASDKRDREQYETRMEYLDQIDDRLMRQELEWRERLVNMAWELRDMVMAGASEDACKEKIRSYLDGEKPPKHEEQQAEMQPVSKELWGNALRQFCRFAASEVPLSARHVQVAEHCRRFVKQAKEMGMSLEDLGLDPQERMVVWGTIEMGALVKRGLAARAVLTSERQLPGREYRECLRNYLAMKGMEETLVPHVQTFQKEISAGDGPVSALQILMANPGFRANDLRTKAGRTNAVARLERMDPLKVARMICNGSDEIAAMGRQVMIDCCQMGEVREPVHEPRMPRKGGPVL